MRKVRGRKLATALPADSAFLCAALRDAFDAVVITSAELDPPGPAILFVNRAFEEMTGYRSAEVLGRTPRLLQGPATDRRALVALRRSLDRGRKFSGEVVNYRKDGKTFWVEWRICPVRTAQGRISHWISFQRDVTARRRLAHRPG